MADTPCVGSLLQFLDLEQESALAGRRLRAVAGDAGAVAVCSPTEAAQFQPFAEAAADRGDQALAVHRTRQRAGRIVARD
jgi:hypothetical protein